MRKGFISYSHPDKAICEALFKQLGPISRSLCSFWYDREMKGGTEWNPTIGWHLNRCHIGLILLSPDSLRTGGFVTDIELPKLKRRATRKQAVLVPITARNADFLEFDEIAERNFLPKANSSGFYILGPEATQSETDDWCAAVVDGLRQLLESLPELQEHDDRVSRAIETVRSALSALEASDEFDAVEDGLSNDIERQITGTKAAVRSPRADFAYTVNAIAASWRQKVVTRLGAIHPLSGHARQVYGALTDLDATASEADYEWPPDKQRAEQRGLVARTQVIAVIEDLESGMGGIDLETRYLAQPGREPAKTIADTVSDKTAVARALADGEAIDGEGVVETLSEADRIVRSGKTELQAAENLEGGPVDLANIEKLAAETEAVRGPTAELASLTPPPPDDETRKQWELEAAVAVLTGKPIPSARQPQLRDLSLAGWDDALFGALTSAGAPLGDLYDDPEAEFYERRLKHADLSLLKGLANLQTLLCHGTQVADLSPLQDLTNLQTLVCSNTQVADLAPLKGLANLQSLSCYGTGVADLAPLQDLANLQILDCQSTQVSDLSPLQGLANLQTLFCNRTPVSDLSPLQGLANLQTLNCFGTPVADLSPLQGLANLQQLDCDSTQVSDLSPLQGLANLQTLNCRDTQVTDWSPVDHVDDVKGRPKDWRRKGRAKGFWRRG